MREKLIIEFIIFEVTSLNIFRFSLFSGCRPNKSRTKSDKPSDPSVVMLMTPIPEVDMQLRS